MTTNKVGDFIFAVVGRLAVAAGIGFLTALIVKFLINDTFSAPFLTFVFGAPKITFWKAFAVSLIITWLSNDSGIKYKGNS
jgi:hypothetical protein